MDELESLKALHRKLKPDIEKRLAEFQTVFEEGCDAEIFTELVFCLFTPQSKAKSCWAAVERLLDKDLLLTANGEKLAQEMCGVRFHHTKAKRVVEARKKYLKGFKARISDFKSPKEAREWLVKNVVGMSYKESSHFLRNIGMGRELAILDRHILKNLVTLGIIEEVPKSLSPKKYLEIEARVADFCLDIGMPMDHLDMLLWCRETGEIFK